MGYLGNERPAHNDPMLSCRQDVLAVLAPGQRRDWSTSDHTNTSTAAITEVKTEHYRGCYINITKFDFTFDQVKSADIILLHHIESASLLLYTCIVLL